ncbi:uncharacterized protein MEPE_04677 [Melanopsichium pennsylvanicum]|uniref:Uncharacterized protein n=2 Tax=Melanopsichium pennsylvanicum TaxID=63383 RepID=A0AAJ4XPJ6_9BASI|nr:uncharacterized protein BN887_06316 [Melanopsichium pennsylvanicum 4]SNX85968.1 uncharacterized protein MEPE_04677 [Melanopsichium pennsylvanicum]
MPESGRTCACTPRSLLIPVGGVTTLDPSQRVSAKQLAAKDREWQRQRSVASSRNLEESAQTTESRRRFSRPLSYVSSITQVSQLSASTMNDRADKKAGFSLFNRNRKSNGIGAGSRT